MRETFENWHKADVHHHLHLGANPSAVKNEYSAHSFHIPEQFDGLDGMIDFIDQSINPMLQTKNDIIFFMESAIESCIADKVVLLEASVDLNLYKYFNNSIEKFILAIAQLKEKYSAKIKFQPELGINKDWPASGIEKAVFTCLESGIFNGIDLYAKEKNRDLSPFQKIFEFANVNGLTTKVHIGEFSSSQSIEDAIHLLQPDQIQHGIAAANSKKTMDIILNHGIRLNICPTSNLILGAVKNIQSHPIRKLYDHGINITINTDDFLLFGTSLSDEFFKLWQNQIFSIEELDKIRLNALEPQALL